MYTDAHAHISEGSLLEEADSVIERFLQQGGTQIVNACTSLKSLEAGARLAKQHPSLLLAAGIYPLDKESDQNAFLLAIEHDYAHQLVAIGEIGLDYDGETNDSERLSQKSLLIKQCQLAHKLNLPIMIHCRNAFCDLVPILDEHAKTPVMIHCFTGGNTDAQLAIERQWMLSINGIVTFPKSIELQEVVANSIPDHLLLVETDAPYLAPVPLRGKRNEPALIVHTIAKIASLRKATAEMIGRTTAENALRFFRQH